MVVFSSAEDLYVNVNTVLIVAITLAVYAAYRTAKRPAGLPPGPTPLPFIGNMLVFFSKTPAQQIFQNLAKKYGSIFSLVINGKCLIMLNSSDIVREALLKKAVEFAGRPPIYSSELFTEGFKNIVMSDYSQQWRYQRKLGHTAMRYFAQKEELEKLVFGVTPEIGRYLDELGDKPFTPKWILIQIVASIVCNLCFGKQYKFNQPELMDWIDAHTIVQKCFNGGLSADFIPILRYIPTPGEIKLKQHLKTFHQKFYDEFSEHQEKFDPQNLRDFMDLLLLAQKQAIEVGEEEAKRITDKHLIHTVVDIVVAGTETTTTILHWAVALMAEHSHIQERVAMELDEVIGHDRLPSLANIGSLPYTEATILEIFRYGVALPVGVPHSVLTDTTLGNYSIPRRATVLVNHFALHYDPQAWPEPDKFKPERFLDENGQVMRKLPDSFLPFGCGRRVCLGKDFAQKEIFLLFVWLFGRYTIYKAPGKEHVSLLKVKQSAGFSHQPLDEIEVCVKKRF